MYATENALDGMAAMPWWRQVALTTFAVVATSHLAEARPHGPFLVAVLLVFLSAQVKAIIDEDPGADALRYAMQVFSWVLVGPVLVSLAASGWITPVHLKYLRVAAALLFLQAETAGRLAAVATYGRAAVLEVAPPLFVELVLVWGYCVSLV